MVVPVVPVLLQMVPMVVQVQIMAAAAAAEQNRLREEQVLQV
jgi:hypothetical protein